MFATIAVFEIWGHNTSNVESPEVQFQDKTRFLGLLPGRAGHQASSARAEHKAGLNTTTRRRAPLLMIETVHDLTYQRCRMDIINESMVYS